MESDAAGALAWPKLVEVGQVWQANYGDVHNSVGHLALAETGRVFLRQLEVVNKRHHAPDGHTCSFLKQRRRGSEQRCVAAKLVQYKAAHQRALLVRQPLPGTE